MPVNYDDLEKLFHVVETNRYKKAKADGFEDNVINNTSFITDEEKQQCYRWADGQEIAPIANSQGYEIIIGKLQRYMDDGIRNLVNTLPTDKEAVLANHSVAFAAHNIYQRLSSEIAYDLEAAKNTPEIVKEGLRLTRGIPAESA